MSISPKVLVLRGYFHLHVSLLFLRYGVALHRDVPIVAALKLPHVLILPPPPVPDRVATDAYRSVEKIGSHLPVVHR